MGESGHERAQSATGSRRRPGRRGADTGAAGGSDSGSDDGADDGAEDGSDGGTLPDTGGVAGHVVAGGVLLTLAGFALVVADRRRRAVS